MTVIESNLHHPPEVPVAQRMIERLGIKPKLHRDGNGKTFLGTNIDEPDVRAKLSQTLAETEDLRSLGQDVLSGKKHGFFHALVDGTVILTIFAAGYLIEGAALGRRSGFKTFLQRFNRSRQALELRYVSLTG